MTEPNIIFVAIVGAFVAAASAYLGSIMVLKRMALVGDALTHVALPGMAIAISLHIDPSLGAFTALTLAIVSIWYLEKNSSTYPEAIVGVFFTASLALGVLLTNEVELLEALFGSIEKLTFVDGILSIILSVIVLVVTFYLSKKLLIIIVSEEMAATSGINVSRTNLIYMLLVGLIVALGIKFVGTLLMGALVIIPAVTAKNVTKSINSYFVTSVIFGVLSSTAGILISNLMGVEVGPVVVLLNVLFYLTVVLASKILKK